jgi:CheY-like chemotaxis protein
MHVFTPCQHRSTSRRNLVAPAPRKPLILVVEDHDVARKALVELLSTTGYDVVEAENGREALATLVKGARPDVILLDLMMPVMDGWEFLKRQRSDGQLCTIPTIVMTGVPSHDPRCLEMPIVRFLPKPYTSEKLMAAIEAEVSRPPLRPTSIASDDHLN